MDMVDRFFWLICSGVIIANWLFLRARALNLAKQEPHLRQGYLLIADGFLRWLLPLFMIVSIGTALGWSGIFAFPIGEVTAQPFDFMCYGLMILIIARSMYWILAQDGAEFLAEHRKIFNTFPSSPLLVKVIWTIGAIMLLVAWTVQML